ncbi:MAG: hypothetical protein ABL958_11855, partial [Bdellovibrionia bacterium]
MKRTLFYLLASFFLFACNTGGGTNNGYNAMSEDFREQGLGSWSEIKELQLDSPEMQPPAGCDTSSAK